MNPPVVVTSLSDMSLREKIANWVFTQGASTVLLVGLVCINGALGYYALHTAIPAALTQIHSGYAEIQELSNDRMKVYVENDREKVQIILDQQHTIRSLQEDNGRKTSFQNRQP